MGLQMMSPQVTGTPAFHVPQLESQGPLTATPSLTTTQSGAPQPEAGMASHAGASGCGKSESRVVMMNVSIDLLQD
jgi:hypothetical protein